MGWMVLSRAEGESIMVGNTEVKVHEIRGNRIRLAVNAAPETPIHRKEVYEAVEAGKGKSND